MKNIHSKIFVIILIAFGGLFLGEKASASTANCTCATGNTGWTYYVTFNTEYNTHDASSEAQCSSDCATSVAPKAGEAVYYKYNSGSWRTAQQSCNALYGGDFACIASANIKNESQCKSSCSGGKCCPTSSALNFVGGSNPQQCATGYMCKNILTVPEAKRASCTSGCTAPDISNGSCCPTTETQTPAIASNEAIVDNKIPGQLQGESEFIKCGRASQNLCTLCDLIAGLNNVIQYIMKVSIFIGLAAFTAGGVMYIISFGDKGMIDMGKGTMRNAVIGFVIIFSAWLIINYTIYLLGARNDKTGMLGIHVVSWGKFDCNSTASQH